MELGPEKDPPTLKHTRLNIKKIQTDGSISPRSKLVFKNPSSFYVGGTLSVFFSKKKTILDNLKNKQNQL